MTGANRDQATHWRRWYKTARWQRHRAAIIKQRTDEAAERGELLRCAQTNVILCGGRKEPNAAVADHIEPPRGDPALFWDPANIQIVAKRYHDSEKQRLENQQLRQV